VQGDQSCRLLGTVVPGHGEARGVLRPGLGGQTETSPPALATTLFLRAIEHQQKDAPLAFAPRVALVETRTGRCHIEVCREVSAQLDQLDPDHRASPSIRSEPEPVTDSISASRERRSGPISVTRSPAVTRRSLTSAGSASATSRRSPSRSSMRPSSRAAAASASRSALPPT